MPSLMTIAEPRPVVKEAPQPAAADLVSLDVFAHAGELLAHQEAWSTLARQALAPNPFYEPWMLLPALEAFGGGVHFRFVLVWRRDPGKPKAPPALIGFFPLEERRRSKGLPLRSLTLWKHMHCFLCTPILHKDHAREALEAFLAWTRRGKTPRLLQFDHVEADGPFQYLLTDVLNTQGHLTFLDDLHHRALLKRPANTPRGEAYLETVLSTGNRKELRRQHRRLGEQGKLALRVLDDPAQLDRWLNGFLDLEAAGWKGREGTALGSDPAQRGYFRAIAAAAMERKQLLLLGLFLDERPIALKCNFLSPPGSFAFKIAFDETLSRFSPGVQLELDNVVHVLERPDLEWMDSCAVAQHFMINRLWRDRRAIQSLWISTGGWCADLFVGVMPLFRALKRFGRRTAEKKL